MSRDLKAVSLAAGLATRLRPLSLDLAKAAIPLCGIPSLYYALHHLARAGISDVAINSHHLPDQVADLVDDQPFGLSIFLSHEPQLLGSGGVYPSLASWRQGCDLLVYNPDIIGALNLESFVQAHREAQALVSIAVLRNTDEPERTSVHVDEQGFVRALGLGQRSDFRAYYGYGAFLLNDQFLQTLPASGSYSLVPHLREAIDGGHPVKCFLYDGYWADIGNSPQALLQTQLDLIAQPDLSKQLGIDVLWEKFNIRRRTIDAGQLLYQQGCDIETKAWRGAVGIFHKLDPEPEYLEDCCVYSQPSQSRVTKSLIIGEYTIDG